MNRLDKFVRLTGFDALKQTLDNLAYKDKKRILIPALKRAVKPTAEMAKANAPKKTGNLEKSIGILSNSNEVAVIVGARMGGGYKGFHGHLVNDGTVERFRKSKNNATTGKMGVTKSYFHFFTKAVKATEKQAIDSLAREWQRGIARMIIRSIKESV